MRISLEQARSRYGQIVAGKWADETKWCNFFAIPDQIVLTNSASGFRIRRIYCNRDMGPALEAAFASVVAHGLEHELSTYDGCLMIRDVRGEPGKPSTHSYAVAIDFDAKKRPLGSQARFSPAFVQCFADQGFSYGGDFARKDPMHFSLAWE